MESDRNVRSERDGVQAEPRRVIVVRSPKAGRGARGEAALAALRARGVEIADVMEVAVLDQRAPLGRVWREQGYSAAVAAGGDGTIGAVATQLAGSDLPLGILPLGTSNDTARSLGIPLDIEQAAATIAGGQPTPIDAGMTVPATSEPFALSPDARDPSPEHLARVVTVAARGAYFLHALTLGLNVAFARLATDVARRERWGRLNYAASAVEALMRYEPLPITLRLSGVKRWQSAAGAPDPDGDLVINCNAVQLAAVNLPVFGGNLDMRLPGVSSHDSLLDFVLMEAPEPHRIRQTVEGWLSTLREAARRDRRDRRDPRPAAEAGTTHATPTANGEAAALPGIHRYQAYAASIETPHPVDVTLDGEVRGRTPAVVRVTPEPLRILLPARPAEGSAPATRRTAPRRAPGRDAVGGASEASERA